MSALQGRRLPDGSDLDAALPGDYWRPVYAGRQPNEWWFRDPLGAVGRITTHAVEEHEDGTITVRPSIARTGGDAENFHGWLTRGAWSW